MSGGDKGWDLPSSEQAAVHQHPSSTIHSKKSLFSCASGCKPSILGATKLFRVECALANQMDGLLAEIQQLFLDAGKDHDGADDSVTLSLVDGVICYEVCGTFWHENYLKFCWSDGLYEVTYFHAKSINGRSSNHLFEDIKITGLSRADILHLCKDVITDETNRIVKYIQEKLSKS